MTETLATKTAEAQLPAIAADPSQVARIRSTIDITDRAQITTFGDGAQRSVTAYADKILAQTRNKDLGETGQLLTSVLEKAKGLDPASLKDSGFLGRLFSSMEARVRRFAAQFEDVAARSTASSSTSTVTRSS